MVAKYTKDYYLFSWGDICVFHLVEEFPHYHFNLVIRSRQQLTFLSLNEFCELSI